MSQVKSKQRVADHGEVFTSDREVYAMLDLVQQETERIDSRFLEPACGTGNFLVEILRRKLTAVEAKYKKSQLEYERYAVIAISSIYGVDIMEDNVLECRDRLLKIFKEQYARLFRKTFKEDCVHAVHFILDRNILWGDALTLRTIGEIEKPIVFSEWSLITGSQIKRRDYLFNELTPADNGPMFSNTSHETGKPVFIPVPINEFPPRHYLQLTVDA